MKQATRPATQPARQSATGTPALSEIASSSLFGNATEVIINHLGVAYRLRRTRNGKLLLYK